MKLEVKETELKGVFLIIPIKHKDDRGEFSRLFCCEELFNAGISFQVKQINHSVNCVSGTLRGMHFQYPPRAEAKIVRCVKGRIYDVLVDVRKSSPTYLKWQGFSLSPQSGESLYIPSGFAHGFQSQEENTELLYLHSELYSPGYEGGIRWDDPVVSIDWPSPVTVISERDMNHTLINDEFMGVEL